MKNDNILGFSIEKQIEDIKKYHIQPLKERMEEYKFFIEMWENYLSELENLEKEIEGSFLENGEEEIL